MLPNMNLFHLTLLVALLFVGDWMTPTPSYMLTCNLFQHTCFSCLKSTFFILSYQLHCCWLDDPHRFPGPTHSTGGRGVDVMTMTMAGGVGGGPGTWNIYTYTYVVLSLYCMIILDFRDMITYIQYIILFDMHMNMVNGNLFINRTQNSE